MVILKEEALFIVLHWLYPLSASSTHAQVKATESGSLARVAVDMLRTEGKLNECKTCQ